jgi:PKHD-type hydroxylase
MMLHIPQVLRPDQLAHIRQQLAAASWQDGKHTAGAQASTSKHNLQLAPGSDLAAELGQTISAALKQHPLFVSAALPFRMLQPLFNRYQSGGHYGNHVDGAIHVIPGSDVPVRTDVSTTVFLSEPDEYEGGELVVHDAYGVHEVKLAAGDAIVYPATSLHRVEPVTAGVRLASFLWTQSMVRDDWQRSMLYELDMTVMSLRRQLGDSPDVLALSSHYHNLLRQWAML